MSAVVTSETPLSMNSVLKAVRNDFSACLPELRQCEVHDGRFGLEELRRIATHAPAVLIAVIGVPAVADPGTNEIDCELQIVAYIITRDGARLPRGEAARVIAQTLLLKIRANRWGLTGAGVPERLRADNLYSGDIDRHGVALWAVLWRQKIRVGESAWNSEGVVPSELYLGFSPEIGKEHEDDYQLVEALPNAL